MTGVEPSVRNAIARITAGNEWGTGFLVAQGLVLTAMHVVADINSTTELKKLSERIELTFADKPPILADVAGDLWDARLDWALLRFEWPADAGDWQPLPLAELQKTDERWWTFGFPKIDVEGLTHEGKVRNWNGRLFTDWAYQLFCEDSAGGAGSDARGFSGSPVFVGNSVVGILRFALADLQFRVIAGELFACPMATVLANQKARALLPVPDPVPGLPGLPSRLLPANPFRYLAWYTAEHAEVFFGRNQKIGEMYGRLTSPDEPPILLFYGQTGAGKSSFLDAGLQPRLEWNHKVFYLRRDAANSLLGTLQAALGAKPGDSLADAWLAFEATAAQPLIVFFDQIEEIHTHPNKDEPEELKNFAEELKGVFGGDAPLVRGRLVLSFRKEWFPEIQKQMEDSELPWSKEFLEALDYDGIVECVKGLASTQRLRNRYKAFIEPGLGGAVAEFLLRDHDSPIAPALQILLTRMWVQATAASSEKPELTRKLFESVGQIGLDDFFDQQMTALKAVNAEWVDSGFALDVMACHVAPSLTSRQCTKEMLLRDLYPHRAGDIPPLLDQLKELYLLSDSSQGGDSSTRLGHDTLVPIVQRRVSSSELPGQKARRLLESHAVEYDRRKQTGLLDRYALMVVDGWGDDRTPGRRGMRALTAREEDLVADSAARLRRDRTMRSAIRAAAAVLVLGIAGSAIWAEMQRRRAVEAREEADLRYAIARAAADVSSDNPQVGLLEAVRAVGFSKHLLGYVSNQAVKTLEDAMDTARERFDIPYGGRAGAISADGVMALVSPEGSLTFLKEATGEKIPAPEVNDISVLDPACLAFSPDNKLLTVATDEGLLLWVRKAGRGQVLFEGAKGVLAAAFSPDSQRVAIVTRDGEIHVADVSGKTVGSFQTASIRDFSHAAIVFASSNEGYVAAANGNKAFLFDLTGKLLSTQDQHLHPVMSIAVTPVPAVTVASADDHGNVIFWDRDGKNASDPMRIHGSGVRSAAFGPSGVVLASIASDASVNFTTPTGRRAEIGQKDTDGDPRSVSFSPDGNEVLVASDLKSKVFDAHGIRLGRSLPVALHPPDIERLTPGQTVITMGGRQTIAVVQDDSHAVLWHYPSNYAVTIDNGSAITDMAFSEDERIFVTASSSGDLREWDRTWNLAGGPWHVAEGDFKFSLQPAGDYIVTWDRDTLRLWDTRTRRNLDSIPNEKTGDLDAVQFLRDGAKESHFVTWANHQIQLWAIRGNRMIQTQPARAMPDLPSHWGFLATPNGPGFLAGEFGWQEGKDRRGGFIQAWRRDGASFLPLGPVSNPHDAQNGLMSAVLLPDGKTTVSVVKYTQNVTFCRFERGEACEKIWVFGHVGGILGLAVSTDGETVASLGTDKTVRLLHAGLHSWLDIACNRLAAHPIFRHPSYPSNLDPSVIQDAKDTCRDIAKVSQ